MRIIVSVNADNLILLETVEHEQLLQHFGLTCFSYFSRQKHFIHDTVDLVEVEDKIQLTNIVKIFIQHLINTRLVIMCVTPQNTCKLPLQSCVSPPGRTDCCQRYPHRYRSTDQHTFIEIHLCIFVTPLILSLNSHRL